MNKMDMTTLKNYCLSKTGAFEDFPFGTDVLVIKAASKMFALISLKDGYINLSLKCDPFLSENLRQQYSSVTPGYHLNKKHWNTVIINGEVSNDDIYWMIDHSYERVIKTLTKAQKSELK
jgi:predicted DNA-binding protein (MmcQ/YjbR family)